MGGTNILDHVQKPTTAEKRSPVLHRRHTVSGQKRHILAHRIADMAHSARLDSRSTRGRAATFLPRIWCNFGCQWVFKHVLMKHKNEETERLNPPENGRDYGQKNEETKNKKANDGFFGSSVSRLFGRSSTIGLDISDASIEAVQFLGTPRKHTLQAVSRKKLAADIVRDGEVLKREELIAALEELLEHPRQGVFSTREVIFALPESRTFAHIFTVPKGLSSRLISKTLAEKAAKTIPFSPDSLSFDFVRAGEKEKVQEILYVAAERRIIEGFKEALVGASLKPIACDMESLALSRSCISRYNEKGATTIVDSGSRTTIVSIFDQGVLRFSENIPVAGSSFTEVIRAKHSVDTQEAEEIKQRYGIGESKEGRDNFSSIEPLLVQIGERIQEAHRYYKEQSGRPVIDVVLAGGSSLLTGLDTWLEAYLKLPVRKGAVEAPIVFATAIGLAKRGLESRQNKKHAIMRLIDLLPKQEKHSLVQRVAAVFGDKKTS